MNTINLQVPVSKELKVAAEVHAIEMGFSSLQETIRLFLKKLANKSVGFSFIDEFPVIKLSKKAAMRYEKLADEAEKGIGVYSAKNADDLMRQLNS